MVREQAEDDRELYIYDGAGQRVRKVYLSQTNARTITREVRYLPGLEIRTHSGTGEIRCVITASAGSTSVQVLHWAPNPTNEIAQDQVRYCLNDHLKSSMLELDQHADLISQEWYYPFGGTAYWAGRNATEAKYKTVRYSGKERDATGLYYYGFRYYTPWLQRWINPDPAGYVDGMNLFSIVENNPINYQDIHGLCGGEPHTAIPIKNKNIKRTQDKLSVMREKKEQFHGENLQHLEQWNVLPCNLSIVHTLRLDLGTHKNSELLSKDASSLIQTWDIISASLIDLNDRNTTIYAKDLQSELSGFEGMTFDTSEDMMEHYSQSDRITFGEIAFKLRVPASNIIGTIPFDNGFPNQTGRNKYTIEEKGLLAKAFHTGLTKFKDEKSPLNTYYSIMPPDRIIQEQKNCGAQWNEILIAGRKDVAIHPGFPNTGAISVEEIYILPRRDVRLSDGKPVLPDDLQEVVEKIRAANPNTPIYIK